VAIAVSVLLAAGSALGQGVEGTAGSSGARAFDAELISSDAQPDDRFGFWVAMIDSSALIGAPGDDGGAGAAYIFERDGRAWSEKDKLVASDRVAGTRFGSAAAVANDVAVITAPGLQNNTGAAYVFRRVGRRWQQEAKLTAADGTPGDFFGRHVAVRSLETCFSGSSPRTTRP
jgi:hypothetical protein